MERRERLKLFFEKLESLPAFSSFKEARDALEHELTEIEERYSGVSNDPSTMGRDGRLYPPQDDHVFDVQGRSDLTRLVSKRHNTYISDTGAVYIEVASSKEECLDKADSQGRRVQL